MPMTYEHLDERQFMLAVRRLADTLAGGADASPYLGGGVDYAQTRPYVAGDSTRAIDWRVTARTGKTFTKEYESPKRMTVHLVVDFSASMRLGSGGRTKFDWAVMLVGALALSGIHRQNPAGISTTAASNAASQLRPTLSRDHVHQWLAAARVSTAAAGQGASVATVLSGVDAAAAERGVVVVLSDLHEPDAVPMLKRLAGRHDVLVLRLGDPAEKWPTGGGFFRAAEAETGRRFFGSGRRTAATFADAAAELALARVDCIDLCVGEPFLPRLQIFLRERSRVGHR